MMTLDEANADVEAAQAALDRFDADARRASDAEADARAAFAVLERKRSLADFTGFASPSMLLLALDAARDVHDSKVDALRQYPTMRKPLVAALDNARVRLRGVLANEGGPRAAKLEEDAKKAFQKFIDAHKKCLEFRLAASLPVSGAYGSYNERGKGLQSMLAAAGLTPTYNLKGR